MSCRDTGLLIHSSYQKAAWLFNQSMTERCRSSSPGNSLPARCSFKSSERGKSPMVPGLDCREDGQMCPNGIHHTARSVSAWRYVGVHCHGSEQCHVRVCLCATLRRLRKAIQNRRRGKLSRGIVLIHDNACPHTARLTQTLLRDEFHWDTFDHPPYSPDLAPSDVINHMELSKATTNIAFP